MVGVSVRLGGARVRAFAHGVEQRSGAAVARVDVVHTLQVEVPVRVEELRAACARTARQKTRRVGGRRCESKLKTRLFWGK